MADAVTDRTRLVLVCTPNNPTGPVVHTDELVAFLDRVPRDVLVVIDEAYVEFVQDPQAPDALALLRERSNVAVLRTFSKAYGLAGLRVGFAVAHPPVAAALRKTAVPFGVSGIAQDAAVASLAASSELSERVQALVAERGRVVAALTEQGWQLPATEANFVWFPLGDGHPGLRGSLRRGRARRAALRHGRRPGDHRRDRGERPAARGGRCLASTAVTTPQAVRETARNRATGIRRSCRCSPVGPYRG